MKKICKVVYGDNCCAILLKTYIGFSLDFGCSSSAPLNRFLFRLMELQRMGYEIEMVFDSSYNYLEDVNV